MNTIVRKVLFALIMSLLPLLLFAQASGGQIKRSSPHKTVSIKKKQSTHQNQVNKSASLRQSQVAISRERTKDVIINEIINNMVYVVGGTFTMGATKEQGYEVEDNERPIHQVTLSSFSICKYEVTIEEWNAVMGNMTNDHKDDHKPIYLISWNDCQNFINRLNSLTGKRFRLPTEAEWEYAARGGKNSNNFKYSGSNIYSDITSYDNNDVGSKKPNELGLYDMSGNVWEWCQDIYGPYRSASQTNPTGAVSGDKKVIRGGGYNSFPEEFRVSSRAGYESDKKSLTLGFRLAL